MTAKDQNITGDNHYLSQGYLKHWESSPGHIQLYRILVSDERVPLWRERRIKGIGYQQHLYTRRITGQESDEIEQWFSKEFETPAESAIQRALHNDRLTPDDWRRLVRYLAMHDVRTPARLVEYLEMANRTTPLALEKTMQDLAARLEAVKQGRGAPPSPGPLDMAFPLKVTTTITEGEEFGTVQAETATGRALWLWAIQRLLTRTAKVLEQHKWTIMQPVKGMAWFTTDKPVIRLNFHDSNRYDFKAGWASKGSEILMPLGPEHLLYTRIGERPPPRGTRFSADETILLRRMMAEHAHRYIFAHTVDATVPQLRPRTANAEFYRQELEQWNRWHAQQAESEQHLFGTKP
ncbi:uncharacterized protein DUF4238 [Nitrospirillum amazonense]|uniref:Uncharacterized protein DUF4238 n=1 Tax=Nitrospirillum amazonense TaxID=28077 RepID=A0A560F1Q2_9PROT|nr:DUF4238 domain-containing protein [Nitrospirillum amazonense]TWB15546.1 uncharacterized protein DUF4238 [Nitrospirillum amazonense]